MNWLDQQPIEMLRVAITHSPCCILFSTVEGKMLWGNDAFLEWMGYTQSELQARTWMDISVNDASLLADLEAAGRIQDGYLVTYKVKKQYIPKNSRPRWGTLYVLRYPPIGESKHAICVWEPMQDENADAFAITRVAVVEMQSEFALLRKTIEEITNKSLPQKALASIVELGMAYPKVALFAFVFCCVWLGGNTFVTVFESVRKILSGVQVTP